MSGLSTDPRRLARTSGFVALFAVVLFATVGIVQIRIGTAPPNPRFFAPVEAGATTTAPDKPVAVWGAGVSDPAAVTCDWRSRELVPATISEVEDHVVVDDPELGAMTLIGTIEAGLARDVTCSGGGMTSFAFSYHQIGPGPTAVGIGFLVGAGIAALWALLMLSLTRPRARTPRP